MGLKIDMDDGYYKHTGTTNTGTTGTTNTPDSIKIREVTLNSLLV